MLIANQVCFLTKQHPSAINIRRFLQPWESSLRPWEDIWVHQEIFICSSLVQPLLKDQNKKMMEHSKLYKMASAKNRHQASWSLLFNNLHSLKADTSLQESPGATSIKRCLSKTGLSPKKGQRGMGGGGGWGLVTKEISNGEALSRDPILYPFTVYTIFDRKCSH